MRRKFLYPYIHLCSIRAQKKFMLKCEKGIKKEFQDFKKVHVYLQTIIETPVKLQKDWLKLYEEL